MSDWKSEYTAPVGQIWVCVACGRYNYNRAEIGDESCFLNAVLCYDSPLQEWHAVGAERLAGEVKP